MKRILALVALAAVTATAIPLGAQTSADGSAASAVGALKGEWQQIAGYIGKAAEQMPESDYAFRPTPDVRSFGQLIGHLAGAQFLICAAALGEQSRGAEDEFEKKNLPKAELVAAFKSSTDYCNRAYAQPTQACQL